MMASPSYGPPSYGPWVCPECLYENEDYQQCMGPDCNSVKLGSMFDTSQFAASNQPSSDGRRTTISVAMNRPAAAAARGRGEGLALRSPPFLSKSLHWVLQRQMLLQVLPIFHVRIIERCVTPLLLLVLPN
jgi:hypothetical protein